MYTYRLPPWLTGEESACSAGDVSSIPGLARFFEDHNGNPLQYSCLENSTEQEPGSLQSMGLQRVRRN